MPFIKFKQRHQSKGAHELRWAEGGSYGILAGDIYVINERDLRMLDEKGVKYELLGRGALQVSMVLDLTQPRSLSILLQ